LTEAVCVEILVENEGFLRLRNRCSRELRVEKLVLEYMVGPLSYDKREYSRSLRHVHEEINAGAVLLPGAEMRVRLRDVACVEKVCIVSPGFRECYQPQELGCSGEG